MRIVLVGPTHPYKGGIAQHTTALAHRLTGAGHDVDLWSWSAQYPQRLYPGAQHVPAGEPELPVYARTAYPLSWRRPDSWVRVGRRMAAYDLAVLVVVTPVQAPAYLAMLAALRRRTPVLALCHNVLPHERGRADVRLSRALLSRADAVLVHSELERERAAALVPAPTEVAQLPPLALTASVSTPTAAGADEVTRRLLFFGMVRPYKGLDVLLRALALTPGVGLTVAGEFWEGEAQTRALVADLDLGDRVEIRSGYVPASQVPALLAEADALALPYRDATASAHAYIAHSHGLPVIATRVGNLPEQVRDGVDGLLVPPGNPAALSEAISRLYEPGVLARLRSGAAESGARGADSLWESYVAAVEKGAALAMGSRR